MRTLFGLVLIGLLSVVCGVDATVVAADDTTRFVEEVQPLLEAKCISCHGREKQEGGLRLDSWAVAKVGGERGAAIVPGDVAKSLLVRAITFRDPDLQMPPKKKLTDKEIETLTKWVQAGAVWPETRPLKSPEEQARPVRDAFTDPHNPIRKLFRGERLDLWSLKPLASPQSEISKPKSVDTFIVDRLAKAGLKPSLAADRRTLIRRVTFDLIGLPPTVAEVDAFLADQSSDAFEKVVQRLLNSPRYGERQARLWLDVVRYADTNGYERDEFRPLAWQYRDFVIRSFNQDKPFDQFIREQLAGDELISGAAKTAVEVDMLIATGYLRLGQWDSTASIFQEEPRLRAEMMADLTNTTASAFLGLTMSCCQCHDHKYDPLSQADHFRLRAFFAGVTPRDNLVIDTADEQAAIAAHNFGLDKQATPLRDEQKKLLDQSRRQVAEQRRSKFTPDILELLNIDEAKRDDAAKKKLKPFLDQLTVNDKDAKGAFDASAKTRFEQLVKEIAELEAKQRKHRHAMAATDAGETAPATHIFYQGDFASPRDAVEPGFVSVLHPGPASITRPRVATTGRRLALANWIASADNPWTARVLVNRIWQQHFGTGLVATPNDFGYSGARPTHPELLDWLATEFIRQGWSIKKLHRLIVTSATYQQASDQRSAISDQPNQKSKIKNQKLTDPTNMLLWRQNVQRLDAETLRDSLLAVAGLLHPHSFGKPLWPAVPEDLLKAQPAILEAEKGGDGGRMQGWYTDPVDQTDVRSVFLVRKRCLPIPFLQAFDLPDTTVSCARRDTTVVAPQALMLLNSPEGIRYATALADRIEKLAGTDLSKQIALLFRETLSRSPQSAELTLAAELLARHADQHRTGPTPTRATQLALVDLCRAVLNLNEFVYID